MTRLYTDTQYRVAKTHDIKFLKLQVIFRKRAANFRALLQKIRQPVKIRHPMGLRERWGAGVETHFQEIS